MKRNFVNTAFLQTSGSVYICRAGVLMNNTERAQAFIQPFLDRWPTAETFPENYRRDEKQQHFILSYTNEKNEKICIICVGNAAPGEKKERKIIREKTNELLRQINVTREEAVVLNAHDFMANETQADTWEWLNLFMELPYKFITISRT